MKRHASYVFLLVAVFTVTLVAGVLAIQTAVASPAEKVAPGEAALTVEC